jgi:1,2-phenylacetyl-CoA epoxidase PaaB subunit
MPSYLIFARDRYEEPLELHGSLQAADDDAAAQAATGELGDGDWIEIQLVPEEAIRWIVRPAAATSEEVRSA